MDFLFSLEDKGTPERVEVLFENGRREVWTGPAPFSCELKEQLAVFKPPPGYWKQLVALKGGTGSRHIRFKPFARSGPLNWWHRLHGISEGDLARGSGIRIGVIDEGLPARGPGSCIAQVVDLGGEGWGGPATLPARSDHSIEICSLLCSRVEGPDGFQGIAPGAEIFFAGAPAAAEDHVNEGNIALSVELLADKYRCDLISISAGDSLTPLQGLLDAVRDADANGCLCLFAGGNRRDVRYPARYEDCVAVGAMGRYGEAADLSDIQFREAYESEELSDGASYLWTSSARGESIELLAAGVGLIWNLDGAMAYTVQGTSFAAPVAAGCLAVLLSRDPVYPGLERNSERSQYVRKLFQRNVSAQTLTNGEKTSKYGVIHV